MPDKLAKIKRFLKIIRNTHTHNVLIIGIVKYEINKNNYFTLN